MNTLTTQPQQTTNNKPSTENEIIHRVDGADPERLFWQRLDSAKEYLKKQKFSDDAIETVVRQSNFWHQWFLPLWAMTDRKIIDRMNNSGVRVITWNEYIQQMRIMQEMKWVMGKVLPAIEVNIKSS